MPKPDPPAEFLIRIRALPRWGGAPVICRLRAFLKAARRAWGFACVSIEEAPREGVGRKEPIADSPNPQ
jgi:hypothetical protein